MKPARNPDFLEVHREGLVQTKPADSTQRVFLLLLLLLLPDAASCWKHLLCRGLLGAADATGETNLAAHRCSNFL